MAKNVLALGGFTALVMTGLAPISAASATTIDGCGDQPTGGTLTNDSGVCELVFDTAGDYTWTLPDGVADLYALVVGAGGGAYLYVGGSSGYAGFGGEVEYADLTSASAGDSVSITVGAGGTTNDSTPTAGEDSVVSAGSTTQSAAGGAGNSGMNWGYCASGFDGYWGEGNGASGGGTSASGEACIGGGDGIVPADDSAPGALINDTTEYGHGGGVFLNTWPDFNPGNGANVYYVDETSDLTADTTGYDGYVKFVYTATSSSGGGSVNNKDALAPTGVEYPFGVFAALGAAVVTAGVTLIGRTRRATASKRSN